MYGFNCAGNIRQTGWWPPHREDYDMSISFEEVAASRDCFKDVMLDMETASSHPNNAVVLSIGLVGFGDMRSGVGPSIGDSFMVCPSIRQQISDCRQVDPLTMKWWSQQAPGARSHWLDPSSIMKLDETLAAVRRITEGRRVWAHGITFDIGNLESLFRQGGLEPPWVYNGMRDARTIYRLVPERRKPIGAQPRLQQAIAHHPVGDCIKQIYDLWTRWPQEPAE